MSMARKARATSAPEAEEEREAAARAPNPQDLLGNAALSDGLMPLEEEPSALLEEEGVEKASEDFNLDLFLDEDHGPVEEPVLGPRNRRRRRRKTPAKPKAPTPAPVIDEQKPVEEKVEDVAKAEEEAKAEGADFGILRATTHKVGMTGAAIAKGGGLHDILSGPAADASAKGKIRDGTPLTITEVGETHVKVKYAVGDKNEEGWLNKALFSPQPDLNRRAGSPDVQEDLTYQATEGDQSTPSDLKGTDVQQGGLADCFLIAAMNAVGNANGKFLDDAVQYDASTGLYKVRFYEETGWDAAAGKPKVSEHWETVDGYLPSGGSGPAYAAAAPGKAQWGPIIEKAYAQWKGGYDAIGKGGNSGAAMEALTGIKTVPKNTSALKADEVVPFFEQAQEKGLAVVCGSQDSMKMDSQQPFATATEPEGPYAATLAVNDPKQSIKQGTVSVSDAKGKAGFSRDSGQYPDKTSEMKGGGLKSGDIDYKSRALKLEYEKGRGPEDGKDLKVDFMYRGLIFPAKKVFAWHAYVFESVKDGKIQLYNPWGSWQPDALTPEEFLTYYSNMSTNQVPQTVESKDSDT